MGLPLDGRERLLLGWVASLGIVSAAVASLFALGLEAQAMRRGEPSRPGVSHHPAHRGPPGLHGPLAGPAAGIEWNDTPQKKAERRSEEEIRGQLDITNQPSVLFMDY